MFDETMVQWTPNSVTYVNSTWIQQFLWIALNISLIPELRLDGLQQNNSLSGCISFWKDHDVLATHSSRDPYIPSTLRVADLIVRIIFIDTNQFTHFTENTKLLEHEVREWIDSYQKDARIYCTNSLRFSKEFLRITHNSALIFEADKPAIPYAREIQLVLGVVFCAVLAICLLVAFVLRIRSFVRKQMMHRRTHRTDRECNTRVHFAYDVGEADIFTKPPVPCITFGSNVYPGGLSTNLRTRQTKHNLNSKHPSRLSQNLTYGCERNHLNGLYNRSQNKSELPILNGFQTPCVHMRGQEIVMLPGDPISVVHTTDDRPLKTTPHCTRFLIPSSSTYSSTKDNRRGSV